MQKTFPAYSKSILLWLYYFTMVTAIPLFIERFFPNVPVSSGGWWILYLGLLFITGAISWTFLDNIKPAAGLISFLVPHVALFFYIAKTCQEFECILLFGAILNIIAAGGMVAAAIITKGVFGKLKNTK